MIGSAIWICVWIYFGVVLTQLNDDTATAIAAEFFFVPVAFTIFLISKNGYVWYKII
jgi:membrane protein DedA with SNARE-associated domain